MSPKQPSALLHPSKSLFQSLVDEGGTIDGDIDAVDHPSEIEWFDPILFEKGQKFAKDNFAVIQLVIMAVNCAGFSGKQIAAVFFKNFYPTNTCGARFLSTFRTAKDMLSTSNPLDSNSSLIKEIRRVRKLHKIYARPKLKPIIPPTELTYPREYSELLDVIRADLKDVDTTEFPAHLVTWEPSLYFTQFDVAMVQLGPILPFLLCPKLVGLYTTYEEDEGLRGYFHMSAVVGRMLGLEDRFNLALHPDRELYWELVQKVGLPSWKMADETVIFAMQTLVDQISKTMPFAVTVKSLMYLTFQASNISGEKLWESMGFMDKASSIGIKIGTYMFRFRLFQIFANALTRWVLEFYFKHYLPKH